MIQGRVRSCLQHTVKAKDWVQGQQVAVYCPLIGRFDQLQAAAWKKCFQCYQPPRRTRSAHSCALPPCLVLQGTALPRLRCSPAAQALQLTSFAGSRSDVPGAQATHTVAPVAFLVSRPLGHSMHRLAA